MAPFSPPETGASSILTPFWPSAAPTFWETIGEIVDMSARIWPGPDALDQPLRAQRDQLDVGGVRQHRDDQVSRGAGDRRRRVGRLRAEARRAPGRRPGSGC